MVFLCSKPPTSNLYLGLDTCGKVHCLLGFSWEQENMGEEKTRRSLDIWWIGWWLQPLLRKYLFVGIMGKNVPNHQPRSIYIYIYMYRIIDFVYIYIYTSINTYMFKMFLSTSHLTPSIETKQTNWVIHFSLRPPVQKKGATRILENGNSISHQRKLRLSLNNQDAG